MAVLGVTGWMAGLLLLIVMAVLPLLEHVSGGRR